MPTPIYATSQDLATWTSSTAPANADTLLRSASLLVRQATATAFYAADDTTGLPTDATLIGAFKDATTAQAAFWAVNNIDPTAGALNQSGPTQSKGIGSARLTYDTSGAGSQAAYAARVAATVNLCNESILILQNAGVVTVFPWVAG